MLDVALWSKFPEGYIESKIEPALRERGIRVTKHLSERTQQVDLSGVSVVLYLHEMTSHSEKYRINNIAQSQGKKVIPLSRKQAQWDRNLLPLGDYMSAPRAISDTRVAEFCNTYKELYLKGTPRKEMIPLLKKFWATGDLTNEGQLDMQVRSLVSNRRAPAAFRTWFEKGRKFESRRHKPRTALAVVGAVAERQQAAQQAQKLNGQHKQNGHTVVSAILPTHVATSAQPPQKTITSFPDDKNSDQKALDQLLHEEAEKFAAMKKELETKMAETNAKMIESNKLLEALRIENNKLKSQPVNGDVKLRRILMNVIESVDLDLTAPVDAITKLRNFVKN